jgi:GNAT superfamily N-acetyltransferase
MRIRPAKKEDAQAIVEKGFQIHQEGAYAFLPYDREKVRRLIIEHLEHPEDCFLYLAEDDGRPAGMLMAMLSDYFSCGGTIASDEAFFVEPEHRGTAAAVRLLRAFRQWAKARGAAELCLGISTNVALDRTDRFYERMGLTHVGAIHKQRLR